MNMASLPNLQYAGSILGNVDIIFFVSHAHILDPPCISYRSIYDRAKSMAGVIFKNLFKADVLRNGREKLMDVLRVYDTNSFFK